MGRSNEDRTMTEYKTLTAEQIAAFEERAHQMRAETIRAGFASVGRGFAAAYRATLGRFAATRHA